MGRTGAIAAACMLALSHLACADMATGIVGSTGAVTMQRNGAGELHCKTLWRGSASKCSEAFAKFRP
jgi:hypothetical protein